MRPHKSLYPSKSKEGLQIEFEISRVNKQAFLNEWGAPTVDMNSHQQDYGQAIGHSENSVIFFKPLAVCRSPMREQGTPDESLDQIDALFNDKNSMVHRDHNKSRIVRWPISDTFLSLQN